MNGHAIPLEVQTSTPQPACPLVKILEIEIYIWKMISLEKAILYVYSRLALLAFVCCRRAQIHIFKSSKMDSFLILLHLFPLNLPIHNLEFPHMC